MNATQQEVLDSLRECAGILDQLLNGQTVPGADAVDAALTRANTAIRAADTRNPANAGEPWAEEEDRKLLRAFDAGVSVPQIALDHARTIAGVKARLMKYGRTA